MQPPAPSPQAYRIYVGAFPQGKEAEQIQALRQRYDLKTARITPPHVTLAGTYWRSGPATPENEAATVQALESARHRIQPFELVLGGIRTFTTQSNPVIFLEAAITPGLLSARMALQEAIGIDKHTDFHAHMTLAMRLEQPEAMRMLDDLRGSQWDTGILRIAIDQLWLMQRGPHDPVWRNIHTLKLNH